MAQHARGRGVSRLDLLSWYVREHAPSLAVARGWRQAFERPSIRPAEPKVELSGPMQGACLLLVTAVRAGWVLRARGCEGMLSEGAQTRSPLSEEASANCSMQPACLSKCASPRERYWTWRDRPLSLSESVTLHAVPRAVCALSHGRRDIDASMEI